MQDWNLEGVRESLVLVMQRYRSWLQKMFNFFPAESRSKFSYKGRSETEMLQTIDNDAVLTDADGEVSEFRIIFVDNTLSR